MTHSPTDDRCWYCVGESEPGWIESGNNGPNYSCPVCNPRGDEDRKWEKALAARDLLTRAKGEQP